MWEFLGEKKRRITTQLKDVYEADDMFLLSHRIDQIEAKLVDLA
jgi:hypothetical protein